MQAAYPVRPQNSPGRPAVSVRPAQDPLIDTVLAGRYHILGIVGQGGMGVVYKARQELLDRLVAIKMLKSQFITDESSVKRFKYEAKAASRLNHPHVITVYDFGVAESGEPYIVMEFLVGMSLADAVGKGRALPVERALYIFAQVCDALDHAHNQDMIHRDLKPGNIMLLSNQNQQDYVKVVDFGIAKLVGGTTSESQRLTQTGEIFGSPVYMSPEQCAGLELDCRSDIYGMGIVMYETLMGRLPFMGNNIVETITQHISAPPPPFAQVRPDLQMPEAVEALVMKCLRKDPSVRYGSMAELMYDIMQITGPSMGMRSGLRPTEEIRPMQARLTGEYQPGQTRPTGESRGSQTRASGEFAEAQPRAGSEIRSTSARPTSEFEQTPSRQTSEFRQTQRRTAAGSYSYANLDAPRETGRATRMRQQWDEPVAGEMQQQHSPIVWVLCAVVALLVAVSGSIFWAASNGYFSKQTAATPARTVPAATDNNSPRTTPAANLQEPPVKVKPVTPDTHTTTVTTVKTSPTRQVTVTRRADTAARRHGPRTSPDISTTPITPVTSPVRHHEPVVAPAADEPPVTPTRHHFQGDDYSHWSNFRQFERGQSKSPPPF